MERAALDQFLDTGWMNGAELFYSGTIYWAEHFGDENGCRAIVYSIPAKKVSQREYDYDLSRGGGKGWIKAFEKAAPTEEDAREALLSEPIFEGKTFWQAERDIEWLEHV